MLINSEENLEWTTEEREDEYWLQPNASYNSMGCSSPTNLPFISYPPGNRPAGVLQEATSRTHVRKAHLHKAWTTWVLYCPVQTRAVSPLRKCFSLKNCFAQSRAPSWGLLPDGCPILLSFVQQLLIRLITPFVLTSISESTYM